MKKTRLATSVEISSFIHATEEEERVLQAVKNLLPPDLRNLEYVDVKKSISYGYYGNPIVFLSLNFPESQVDEITLYILSHLPKGDIKSILDDFEKRFARGRLYLRFDKQEAYYGNLKLSEGDEVIKCVIKFKPHLRKRGDFESVFKELGVLS
ncbi:MAG: RNA-binding domain-containing protein [Infirmifilum sp.]|jgi:RNA binding exosome subunit|uniref:Exosome protein n=1 Tax=Infirmifilum uzonense TaxID=1550241 RepID=A0A0F7FIJ2_9CREN|nr:RNA-binding domain-containing protein [Infirmifilum uzonense]AKG39187.1 hypothetical protein MA03_08020 [Infirmifilum uzonense]